MRHTWGAMALGVAVLVAAGCGKTRFEHPAPPAPPAADTTAPAEVTNLTATPGPNAGEVTLAWTPSTSPDVAGYVVTVTELAGGTVVQTINPVAGGGSANGLVVTGLTTGVSHSFLVQAFDAIPNTSAGVTATASPAALAPVTGLVAIPGNGTVTLQWNPSSSSGVTGYVVRVTDLSTSSLVQTINVTPGTATGTTVTTLTNGTNYRFDVQTIDANNNTNAPPDPSVTSTPSAAADTQAPTNVGNLAALPASQQVTLSWTPATDNVGVIQYNVTVTSPPGTATVVQTLTVTPGSATGVTVTGLTNGTPYRFTVLAQDPSGNVSPGGPASFVDATPGNPAVGVAFSSPGGAYRSAAPPTVTITGVVNGHQVTGAGTGVVFYTVDGSNPVVTGARAPAANGVSDTGGFSNGTFVQANPTPTGLQLGASLTTTQFGPATGGGSTTTTVITLSTGTFPVDGTIRTGDTVRITSGTASGETQTIINNGVTSGSVTVGGAFSAAPIGSTFVIERVRRAVVVRAFYDPGGTVGPPATTSTGAGVTDAARYFFFSQAASTFVPYGGMVRPRWRHTSMLLKTGLPDSVLLVGGELSGATVEEFFDRDTEFFFTITGSPFGTSVARQESQAARLDTPRQDVLVVGGRRIATVGNLPADLLSGANSAVVYDSQGNTLSSFSTAFAQRTLHTATLLSSAVSSNRVLVTGGLSATAAGTAFTADATSGTARVDHSVSTTFLSLGDVVEVVSGPSAGETAVVIQINIPPSTSLQSVTVSPAYSNSVQGATLRRIVINDNSAQLFTPTVVGGIVTGGTWTTLAGAGGAPDALTFTGGVDMRRWGHGAVLLQTGLVLVTGGHLETPTSSTNDIERTLLIFDPTNTSNDANGSFRVAGTGAASGWRDNSARIQHQKFFHTTSLLKNGKVLIAGGVSNGAGYFASLAGSYVGAAVRNSADLFDPSNETTVQVGSLTSPRFFHTATVLNNGKVLLTGGAISIDSASGSVPVITNSAELFDPLSGTFNKTTGSMLTTRIWHAAELLPDGRVLVTGGTGAALPEIYDPNTDIFSATAGTATANRDIGGAAVVLNSGNVLVTGGQATNFAKVGAGQAPGAILPTSEVYDVDASRFVLTPSMAFSRRFHTATLLDDGRALILGGEGQSAGATTGSPTTLANVETYDETTNTWTTQSPMSGGRSGHTATKLRGVVLHTTGTATFNGTTTVTGTGTNWLTDGVAVGDRIRLDSDGTFFEITAVASNTSLTIAGAIGGIWPTGAIPTGAGAYTIRSENPYTVGTASFTFGLATVSGTGTAWSRTVRPGDLIRPTGAGIPATIYRVQTVSSDTSLTLTAAYSGASVASGAYTASAPGQVLVTGGGPAGSPLSSGELYDSAVDNWVSVTNGLAMGRFAHTATRLANGMVLIVGGNNNFDRTAELYDPAMNRFAQIVLPTIGTAVTAAARNNHQSALLANGQVFICGGDVAQSAVEIFTPNSDGSATADADGDGFASTDFTSTSFTSTGTVAMSVGRVNHTITVLGPSAAAGSVNRILIVGGKSNALNTADLYDVATTDTTGSIALGRQGIEFHTATLLPTNNNVLIIRGHTAQVFFSQ